MRFGAEIGFLEGKEDALSPIDKVPNGQKSTFFTGMGQFGFSLEEELLARALEKLLVSPRNMESSI